MSGAGSRAKCTAQASASRRTSAAKTVAAAAGIITLVIAGGQLALSFRDGARKERDRCYDAKFLDQLVSCNPQKRALATAILKTCAFPKEDVDNILNQTHVLDQGCPVDNIPTTPTPTPHRALHDPLLAELRTKSLVKPLEDAADFAAANSPLESEQALTRYLSILDRLSPPAKRALDPELMRKYDAAMEKRDTSQAVKLLSSAFRPYVNNR
jgi:hypothetical protein